MFSTFSKNLPRDYTAALTTGETSNLSGFAIVSNHVTDFSARNKCLTANFLQGYGYHKLRESFSKFYCRHYELISKLGLKDINRQ